MHATKVHFILYIVIFLVGTIFQGFAEEPKSLRELRTKIEKAAFTYTEPREFFITRDDSLYFDKKASVFQYDIRQDFIPKGYHEGLPYPCNQYILNTKSNDVPNIVWIYIVPFKSFAKSIILGNERVVWTSHDVRYFMSAATYPPPFQDGPFRPFFDSYWVSEPIGIYSYEYRFGNMEKHTTYSVSFYRGNVKTYVFYSCVDMRKGISASQIDYDVLSQISEAPLSPDPREIAWRIDQYLKGDPLEKLGDDEKTRLNTLAITLPNEQFEQGKEYPLDFPRRLPDGTVPAEIRLVVSRGEVQQVIGKAESEDSNAFPNPASLAPDINGNYTVLFGQPGVQTVHCYHINEEGKCLAWGMLTQKVSPAINTPDSASDSREKSVIEQTGTKEPPID